MSHTSVVGPVLVAVEGSVLVAGAAVPLVAASLA